MGNRNDKWLKWLDKAEAYLPDDWDIINEIAEHLLESNSSGCSVQPMVSNHPGDPNIKIDEFHYHEYIDRCYCINNIIYAQLIEHPVTEKHENLCEIIKQAMNNIVNAYQLAVGYQRSFLKDDC